MLPEFARRLACERMPETSSAVIELDAPATPRGHPEANPLALKPDRTPNQVLPPLSKSLRHCAELFGWLDETARCKSVLPSGIHCTLVSGLCLFAALDIDAVKHCHRRPLGFLWI